MTICWKRTGESAEVDRVASFEVQFQSISKLPLEETYARAGINVRNTTNVAS